MEIFGYKFADIQRAQQGGRLNRVIDTSLPRNGDINSAEFQRLLVADLALLEKHGRAELEKLQYSGTLDRLERAGKLERLRPGQVAPQQQE